MSDKLLQEMSRDELIRELRKHAIVEDRVARSAGEDDRERLIHDLHVHQVELEMQNRELREAQRRLEEATLRYADLYDFAPVGYCTLGPEGNIREINLMGARLLGRPREDLLGKPFASTSPLKDRRRFDAHLQRCANGEARVTSELVFVRAGGGEQALEIISDPIVDASGGTSGCRSILIDISDRKQLEQKLRLLASAGEVLSASFEYAATLKAVVSLAVPAIADLCMIDMAQDDGRTERVEVAFADASRQQALAATLKEHRPPLGWRTAQDTVIASGEPLLLAEVPEGRSEAAAPPHVDVMRAADMRSLIVVPLSARGRTFGALTLAAGSNRRYTAIDLRLAEDLARRAAMALDNARLFNQSQQALSRLSVTQEELRALNQTLEQRVGERTKMLALMHEVTKGINDASSWDEGLQFALRRICESENWQVGSIYVPGRDDANEIVPAVTWIADESFRPLGDDSALRRYARGQPLPGRVLADGHPLWVDDPETLFALMPRRERSARRVGLQAAAVLPIRSGSDVIAVIELFSDQPRGSNEVLENLMTDLGAQVGKVLERERSTAQMADRVWREQQALLHTLHDSLGQTLTALGMLSSGLHRQLEVKDRVVAGTAQQIAEQAKLALEQVRQLSRGLFPVEVDPEGLLPALRELASTTETFHRVAVRVSGDLQHPIRDGRIATELYRIAQEAVTNAVKHAQAQTIAIELRTAPGLTQLRVIDDGVGMPNGTGKAPGLGLRIMRYRAASFGAQLSIDSGPGGGTAVCCTLRDAPLPAGPTPHP